MKKLTKRILTLALSVTMILGSSISVSAVTSESLNNKQNEYGEGRIAVSGAESKGNLRIQQNDVADSFTIHKIANVAWDNTNQTYKDAEWNFSSWFASTGSAYNNATYLTPAALAKASATVQKKFFEDLLTAEGNIIKNSTYAASYTTVADWVYNAESATGSSTTGSVAHVDSVVTTVTDDNYASLGMEKITKYTYRGASYYSKQDVLDAGGLEENIDNGSVEEALRITTSDCYKETKIVTASDGSTSTIVKYYELGEVFSKTAAYWDVADLSFGIYAIMATNAALEYSPVVIAVAPQQEAPSGNWYLEKDITTNLKAGQVVLDKKINGKEADTVAIGDTVKFEVITSFPSYSNRVTVSTKLSNASATDKPVEYRLSFDDEMSTAFNVDQSSFQIYYRESTEGEWKAMEDYQNITFYALGDSTVASGNTLITEINAADYGYTAAEKDLYAVKRTGDVFTPIIGSKATAPATDADAVEMGRTSSNASSWGNRGGLGISAFGCINHQSEFQMYILRNPSQPRLLYSYYLKDGQFTFMEVADIDNDRYTKDLTKIELVGDEYHVNTSETYYSNGIKLNDGSSYLYHLRDEYNRVTGSTNSHGMQYFANWAKNVFNISFDVNALKKWQKDKGIATIQQIRVTYDATVTGEAQVNSEANTNTATLTYETSSDGKQTATMSDTVRAYTYALNVVKIDGATAQDASPKPLAGAVFTLYKETDTFISTTDDADASYVYKGSMEGTKRGETEVAPTVDSTTLEAYKTAHSADGLYYYSYQVDAAGSLDSCVPGEDGKLSKTKVTCSGGNYITRVFKPVVIEDKVYNNGSGSTLQNFSGVLTSVASLTGVTVKGLDTGNYILSETTNPTGYNKLAEDILFSLYELNEDIASTTYGGSYKFFADAPYNSIESSQTITDDDGVYKLNVLNYKGLTLPSTGGMGTLLFTILGIILMITALIVTITKNRKRRNSIITYVLFAILMGSAALAMPQQIQAVTTIQLNNDFGNKVTGESNTVSFKVELKNTGDTIEVYPIAELKWDAANDTYTGPEWTLGVSQYLAGINELKAYDTPVKLGEAEPSVQTAALKQLYDGRDTNNLTSNKVDDGKVVLSEDGMSYQVSGVPYGIYLIKAKNTSTGKEYAELTVNAMPTQEGPMGYWYLKSDITASLKFSSVTCEKTINGEKSDTVAIGEVVKFAIVGEVPEYPNLDADGNELVDAGGNPDYSSFNYAMVDTMSKAFAYDKNGVTVEYGVKNEGTGKEDYTTLDAAYYTVLFDKAAANSNGSEGLRLHKETKAGGYVYSQAVLDPLDNSSFQVKWYAYDSKTGVLKLFYEGKVSMMHIGGSNQYSSALYAAYTAATGVATPSFTIQSSSNWTDLYNVTFDYAKLRELNADYVRVSYKAEVTQDIEVGADTNTNQASFYYQEDIAGNTTTVDSEVKAWTYAVKIVKTDGTTDAPLADAKFHIYKEAYTYVPDASAIGTEEAQYGNYVWSSNVDGSASAPVGTVGGTADTSMDTLEKLNKEDDGDYYFRIVDIAGSCAEDVAGCDATGDHKHIIAYKLYTYKDTNGNDATEIVSVNSLDGVTIKGLEPASYVLIETSAPLGYNEMLEALRFEINEIGLDDPNYLDSKKAFYSDEEIADGASRPDVVQVGGKYYQRYDDGVYPIEVKNFKGLVLPSTGGMGTLLFTIVGILLMFFAMVVVILKKRNERYV